MTLSISNIRDMLADDQEDLVKAYIGMFSCVATQEDGSVSHHPRKAPDQAVRQSDSCQPGLLRRCEVQESWGDGYRPSHATGFQGTLEPGAGGASLHLFPLRLLHALSMCFVNRFSAKSEKLFPVFGSGIPFFRIGAWKALVIT